MARTPSLKPPHSNKPATLASMLLLCAASWSCTVLSADIAREVRQGDSGTSASAEISFTASHTRMPLVGFEDPDETNVRRGYQSLQIGLHGMVEWRGLFAEALHEGFGQLTLGYHAWESDNSSLDLTLTSQLGEYIPGDVAGFESVNDRDGDFNFGLRSTHMRGNNIIQLELMTNVSDTHDGIIASGQFGRSWQKRNWNYHAIAGLRYFSSGVTDYYFGIDENEVSANTPRYQADSGTMLSGEIGATLPINEKWLFKGTAQAYRFPDAVAESPLAQGRAAYRIEAGVFRVF